ncbi:aminoacyl-histidine dipeptidase [Vibrio panuliri]|uniref:Cytosol non-specific dipeptidase n=1 Tax=Vibrio panuliri TaxID=1381081 RepID=A0A1Q9HLP5_9VIBR|nr:aminoacyl-histidine dipeptidase [Vibrio panuliri]KAB1453607.1 aminoacyl-histidine dipeptidase [Vibrio panuliri]OLQ84696.1 cytosol nonspecific dipeptidase [Vibrio panuliri]OLQ91537.1 cytosol nonspecific dipeptidase [Vibrio panuliri]
MSEFHSEISKLSPAPLWQFFDKICSIPHPSKHEEALAQYIVAWAQEQGLDVRRDPTGNVFIKKPATPGMESKKGVVLQAHIDMVPQKNEDTQHDFTADAIQPYVDGEWVTAKGTTLGADNGIGMASCLAVLASTDIKHGPIEVLLTIDEEAGMTGAFGLEAGWLEGDILLNTDSEQEGEVYMGCAGGVDGELTLNVERENTPADYTTRQLVLKGLKGGHSGCDIHTGRGNANKLLGRFLAGHAQELGLRLVEFRGGSLRNAIPREAFVTVALPQENEAKLTELFDYYTDLLRAELGRVETDIVTFNQATDAATQVFSQATQQRFIATLNALPNGVIRMSDDIEGVVETSLNVGVVTTEGDKLTILCLIRSLIDSGRHQVESTLSSVAELAGASIEFSGAYPGWKPDADSEIMQVFRDLYENIYGRKPNIMVIHAGLECGLFKEPYPQMDMLSFGPTIKFPHSPDEKVLISTVALFWEQMVALLENIPEKA